MPIAGEPRPQPVRPGRAIRERPVPPARKRATHFQTVRTEQRAPAATARAGVPARTARRPATVKRVRLWTLTGASGWVPIECLDNLSLHSGYAPVNNLPTNNTQRSFGAIMLASSTHCWTTNWRDNRTAVRCRAPALCTRCRYV